MTKNQNIALAAMIIMVIAAGAIPLFSSDSDAAITADKIGYGENDGKLTKVTYYEKTGAVDGGVYVLYLSSLPTGPVFLSVDSVQFMQSITISTSPVSIAVPSTAYPLLTAGETYVVSISDGKVYNESCEILVGYDPSGVEIVSGAEAISVGSTTTITATLQCTGPKYAMYQEVDIESTTAGEVSDVSLVDGVLTATLTGKSAGTATITVTVTKVDGTEIEQTLDVTVAASPVITSSAGSHGSISPNGATSVPSGGSQTYTITPNTDYSVEDVKVDGVSVGAVKTYTFENVTTDHTIHATFKYTGGGGGGTTYYVVTLQASDGGSVNKISVRVEENSVISAQLNELTIGTVKVTATPATGYVFKEWTGIPSSGKVKSDLTVKAVFEESVVPVEDITKDSEDGNGRVTLPAEYVKKAGITDPSKLILKITPQTKFPDIIPGTAKVYDITLTYDGKKLTSFSPSITLEIKYTAADGEDLSKVKVYYVSDDGTTVENMNASYSTVDKAMVFKTSHLSLFAVTSESIEPVTSYTVTVKTEGSGTAKADVTKAVAGTKVTLTATPADGYEFKSWTSSDVTISNNTFTMPSKNVTVTAVFEKKASPSGDDNTWIYILLVIVIILIIIAVVFYLKKRHI